MWGGSDSNRRPRDYEILRSHLCAVAQFARPVAPVSVPLLVGYLGDELYGSARDGAKIGSVATQHRRTDRHLVNVRAPAGLISLLALLSLLTGCTGGHSTGPIPTPGNLPTCPWSGLDHPFGSPTFISPTDRALHGRITVLARTTPAHETTVHAVVTSRGGAPPDIAWHMDSRIVLTRQMDTDVSAARGIANPLIDPDHLLSAANVVAVGPTIRTTDLRDHELTLVVPRGLPPRDYFVLGVQRAVPECAQSQADSYDDLIGLVRVLTLDGKVARLKRLPAHVH